MLPAFTPKLKQPAERILLRFEFGQPAGVAIDTLVSSAVVAAGRVTEVAPLVIDSAIVGSTYAQLALSGGTSGELYAVTVLVEDANDNRFERDIEVYVLDTGFRGDGTATGQYLTFGEFIARTGIDEAVRLTDEAGTGIVDAARLDAAINDAQAMVDSYLSARFAVPVATPAPAPIPSITFDLAIARLYRGTLPEGVAAKQDAAMRLLKDLAAGKAGLPITVEPTATSPAPVLVAPHERLFTRDRMRGF